MFLTHISAGGLGQSVLNTGLVRLVFSFRLGPGAFSHISSYMNQQASQCMHVSCILHHIKCMSHSHAHHEWALESKNKKEVKTR